MNWKVISTKRERKFDRGMFENMSKMEKSRFLLLILVLVCRLYLAQARSILYSHIGRSRCSRLIKYKIIFLFISQPSVHYFRTVSGARGILGMCPVGQAPSPTLRPSTNVARIFPGGRYPSSKHHFSCSSSDI